MKSILFNSIVWAAAGFTVVLAARTANAEFTPSPSLAATTGRLATTSNLKFRAISPGIAADSAPGIPPAMATTVPSVNGATGHAATNQSGVTTFRDAGSNTRLEITVVEASGKPVASVDVVVVVGPNGVKIAVVDPKGKYAPEVTSLALPAQVGVQAVAVPGESVLKALLGLKEIADWLSAGKSFLKIDLGQWSIFSGNGHGGVCTTAAQAADAINVMKQSAGLGVGILANFVSLGPAGDVAVGLITDQLFGLLVKEMGVTDPSTPVKIDFDDYAIGPREWGMLIPHFTVIPNGCGTATVPQPTGLSLLPLSTSMIQLDWNFSGSAGSFRVFQRLGGSLQQIAVTDYRAFQVNGLSASTQYCFAVSATVGTKESERSDEKCASTLAGPGPSATQSPTVTATATSTATPTGTRTSPPAAPSNLRFVGTTATSISLAWDDNSGNEEGFVLTDGVSRFPLGPNATSFTDSGLAPGLYRCYRIWAWNAGGSSSSTAYTCGTTTSVATPPSAPSGLTAYGISTSTIRVQWLDNSIDEDGFNVYEGAAKVRTTSAGVVGVDMTGLASGSTHCYTVRAFKGSAESGPSNQACATTSAGTLAPPTAPSNLRFVGTTATSISLAWDDNSGNEEGFVLTDGVSRFPLGPNATSFTDSGLAPGLYRCYRIWAWNAGGSSSSTAYTCGTTTSVATPPSAPSGLTAYGISTSTIRVQWLDNSIDEDGFNVYEGAAKVRTTGPNEFGADFTGLAAGSNHCYTVRAFKGGAESAPSNQGCATTATAASSPPPRNVVLGYCDPVYPGYLYWSAPLTASPTGYRVYLATFSYTTVGSGTFSVPNLTIPGAWGVSALYGGLESAIVAGTPTVLC